MLILLTSKNYASFTKSTTEYNKFKHDNIVHRKLFFLFREMKLPVNYLPRTICNIHYNILHIFV